MTQQPSLFDGLNDEQRPSVVPPDQAARDFAVDPRNDVVLEASAGTGKTRVLVDRYVHLLEADVDPRHILAMTFTRKAAAEMRERVLATLRRDAEAGRFPAGRWKAISARLHDVQITTIDGFCFGLLREFPLEAGVDPSFEVADETEMARFGSEALDRCLQEARRLVETDEHVRLLLVRVKPGVLRDAMASLIDRRQVALPAVAGYVARHPEPATAEEAAVRFLRRLAAAVPPQSRDVLVSDGPHGAAEFRWLAQDLTSLESIPAADQPRVHHLRRRFETYFLRKDGGPRQRLAAAFTPARFATPDARRRHQAAVAAVSPAVAAAIEALDVDLDHLLARGLLRLLVIAVDAYEGLLREHALLDFAGMLERTVALLARQEEFARSRLKLQSRYHHLLVDEFQDTSRRQWTLVDLLIGAWAEGEGAADAATSIFVVGDRKQSIYRFRHAEAALLDEAAQRIGGLRGRRVRQAISTSFRSVPELLAFVNALSTGMAGDEGIADRWQYRDTDRFPTPAVAPGARRDGEPVLGMIAEPSMERSAAAVADEIVRLLDTATVRDRQTGARPARPDDIAILFRARAGHQYFEDALERRGVRTYVYKGLGFFDAPEVQDLQALLRFLARPESDLRAAELLRSRFVRLSDQALARLAPRLSDALLAPDPPDATLDTVDANLLVRARTGLPRWLELARRVPPGEVIDAVLHDTAYMFETRGRRRDQARENLKKVRALVRRVENRGYVTLERLAAYFETLRAGDDSNAVVQAANAVNLMTIHAAKGLEFPIVFVVNLHAAGRGRSAGFSVIEQGPDGHSDVTFGTNAATRLEDRREAEELRRLLYVAVTRARDRLYLAGEIDARGRLRKGARSLAGLLPASLAQAFTAAQASSAPEVEWISEHGTFALRVCRPGDASPVASRPEVPLDGRRAAARPVVAAGPVVRTASSVWLPVSGSLSRSVARGTTPAVDDQRLVGTLVHRLFQRRVVLTGRDDDDLVREAEALLMPRERGEMDDPRTAARNALALFRAMRADADLVALLETGQLHYEVPFAFFPEGQAGVCLRGSVDCVIAQPDGRIVVLEFKTGRPRPEHQVQLDLYVRAMAATFPGAVVTGRVCYPPAP